MCLHCLDIKANHCDIFRFLCTYNFQWYPFDIQNCQLQLTMFGKSGDFSTLGKEFFN